MTLVEIKAAARAGAFARRKAAFGAQSGAQARMLGDVLAAHKGRVLAGYMPMRTEIDWLPAMAAHDGCVGVPGLEGAAMPRRFRRWTPAGRMGPGAFGAVLPVTGPRGGRAG